MRGLLPIALLLIVLGGCSRKDSAQQAGARYPEPRFPSYLKKPDSVEDIMPYARQLVRNKSGYEGKGMGVLAKGDTVLLIPSVAAEEMVMEAIMRALGERGVTVLIKPDYELIGATKDEVLQLKKLAQDYSAEQGFREVAWWIDYQFPDPEGAKKWLGERRPDLLEALYPKANQLTSRLKEVQDKLERDSVGGAIKAFLNAHPEVRGVFWGSGGATLNRRAMHPLENKFLGVLTANNRYELMSEIPKYPDDLWLLTEEKSIEAVPNVDKIHIQDPEGTDVSAEITEIMADRWARGVYQRGHLYMFPNQATGRFGYSVIDYPAFQKEYLPREPLALINGTVAGTAGHVGFYPRWEITFKDGFISDVKGGGLNGELLREFRKYPRINTETYPEHTHPGFFYLYEVGMGTNPKYFRNPAYLDLSMGPLGLGPERMRAGMLHLGIGMELRHNPKGPTESPELVEFMKKYNLPGGHWWHTHNYFATYEVHLRNTDRWLKVVDRGHMTSLDDPEVRALASRYGDPDRLLAEDWTPEIPGINAPGKYEDYAANPWKYAKGVIDKAVNGTYEKYFPPAKAEARKK
jgi:hypothetical protein